MEEKEVVKQIMEEYERKLQDLEKKDTENNIKINEMNLHIERLKEERDNADSISEKEEYNKSIEDAEKKLGVYKLSFSKTSEEKRKEELEKMSLKDEAIRELTKDIKEFDKAIRTSELNFEIALNNMNNFEYKYDENHNALNGDEFKKIWDASEKARIKTEELKEAKKLAEEHLENLKQPSKEVEVINSILNGTYDVEPKEIKSEETKQEETKPEEIKPEETKQEETKPEEVKSEETKQEETKPEEVKPEETKQEETKSEEAKPEEIETKPKDLIEELKEKIEKSTDPNEKEVLEQMLKTAELEKESKKAKDSSSKNDFIENFKKAERQIEDIRITSKDATLKYYTSGAKEHLETAQYEFESGDKEKIIKNALQKAYPEKDFESEDGKQEIAKYSKADPNIVKLLAEKGTTERLEEYMARLNSEKVNIAKNDLLYIEYDIRKLSKSDMSEEAKKEFENMAYEHRHIAKVKSTIFQKIKFAYKDFKENRKISKEQKLLEAGIATAPVKDEISPETSQKIKEMIDNKNKDASMNRFEELAKKCNDEFLKETDSWKDSMKVENSDGHIEENAAEINEGKEKSNTDVEKEKSE